MQTAVVSNQRSVISDQWSVISNQAVPGSRITHHVSRFRPHASRFTSHVSRPTPHSGVALVITLVLLSVITFMAVTFLVVSRSQHGAVATETDQQIARFAADTARERAIAELIAPIVATTNEFNYGLLVSANYINSAGFNPAQLVPVDPLNVNYDYTTAPSSAPLTANQQNQNIANLLYNPRPPVFIVTNALAAKSNEFRYYLDLNRNGAFEPSGLLGLTNSAGVQIGTGLLTGDPQWIGGLQRPEFAHSATNLFTHRYAYLVVPAGQTLDLNCIHNQAANQTPTKYHPGVGDFRRNQGVGTFEINLAAFLSDLNTNYWGGVAGYNYIPNGNSLGTPFADASELLAYRYAFINNGSGSFNLGTVSALFPGNPPTAFSGAAALKAAPFDAYSAGPVMLGTSWSPPPPFPPFNPVNTPWSGADNPNRFYTPQDLFDQTKTYVQVGTKSPLAGTTFTDRLLAAGTNTDSYNRYTFYRLLSQLGTDSAPEPGGKMNLNYCNVDNNGYVVPNAATNFIPWQAAQFFNNAAIRLLADAGYTVGGPSSTSNFLVLNNAFGTSIPITNLHIPIWPTNYYTPSVHRLLQLAANMYDATTNRTDLTAYPYLPTVFQPVFKSIPGEISIVGYQEVTNANLVFDTTPPLDLTILKAATNLPSSGVYGIPLVIGAKKGFPNFNKLAMQMQVQVSRKLQFHRPGDSTAGDVNEIDQMYVIGISNALGVEAWNSYAANFPRALQMVVWPDISVLLNNPDTGLLLNQPPLTMARWQPPLVTTNIPANMWPGYVNTETPPSFDFKIPLVTNIVFVPNMAYSRLGPPADSLVPLSGTFERPGGTNFYLPPHWLLTLKPRLRFALVDTSINPNRIVDYVNLADYNVLDVTNALMTGGHCGGSYTPDGSSGSMWCTARVYGGGPTAYSDPTFGIANQIAASAGTIASPDWNNAVLDARPGVAKADAISFFASQFLPVTANYAYRSNTFNAPYQPFRDVYVITAWQANDPLVHYTVGDLVGLLNTNVVVDSVDPKQVGILGKLNGRYKPWGGAPGGVDSNPNDLTIKDPLVFNSDAWDFPTNKFPNAGWVGRVHRGTPWKTVYLKATDLGIANNNWQTTNNSFNKWQTWTGNGVGMTNFGQTALYPTYATFADAYLTQPTNDWRLLDLFTTALSDNATRGQLSINQTNLAAWSAVLSGVMVLPNTPDGALFSTNIQPAGIYDAFNTNTWPPLVWLVKAINDARTNTSRHVFSHLSDLLAVPQLTVASPFLNTTGTPSYDNGGLSDAAYERLPQQIAGLLKADQVPRFVIYSYGQTLKPEGTRAFVRSGLFSGLCTNYQIMAEYATRTVVRFEGIQPYLGANPPPFTALHPVIESITVLPPD
jgi:hypothetical protein